MSSSRKIILFMGSVREGRQCERVTKFVSGILKKNGVEPIIYDAEKIPAPILRQPLHFMRDKTAAPDWMKKGNEDIKSADGYLMITPEYNCGVPPALSNLLDHFPPASYRHRPCGIVTYSLGAFGGCRVTIPLRSMCAELGMVTIPAVFTVPTVSEQFSEEGEPTKDPERLEKNADRLVKELLWYSDCLKRGREHPGVPN